jgi:hypothetical protein
VVWALDAPSGFLTAFDATVSARKAVIGGRECSGNAACGNPASVLRKVLKINVIFCAAASVQTRPTSSRQVITMSWKKADDPSVRKREKI